MIRVYQYEIMKGWIYPFYAFSCILVLLSMSILYIYNNRL